jgi:hypothetical protein
MKKIDKKLITTILMYSKRRENGQKSSSPKFQNNLPKIRKCEKDDAEKISM